MVHHQPGCQHGGKACAGPKQSKEKQKESIQENPNSGEGEEEGEPQEGVDLERLAPHQGLWEPAGTGRCPRMAGRLLQATGLLSALGPAGAVSPLVRGSPPGSASGLSALTALTGAPGLADTETPTRQQRDPRSHSLFLPSEGQTGPQAGAGIGTGSAQKGLLSLAHCACRLLVVAAVP